MMLINPLTDPIRMIYHPTATRQQQAEKIFNLFVDASGSEEAASTKNCLDIGCGSGEIIMALASKFSFILGIEVDLNRITRVSNNERYQNVYFTQADGAKLPFQNETFDFIICAQVYEHTEDQAGLVREISRVLKNDGVCFFSGPNKYTIMEEHYFLPFLSWLPQKFADFYVRLFRRSHIYDVYPLSYKDLKSLLHGFIIEDVNLRLIQNPERYGMGIRFGSLHFIQRLPERVLKPFLKCVPNFNLILRKIS